MFKKSADLIHLHERTGSHSTKGSGRGTVWWYVSGPGRRELDEARLIELRKTMAIVGEEYRRVVKIHNSACDARNGDLMRAVRPSVHKLRKSLKRLKREKIELKAQLREKY
jgi:hypothetical protein